MSGARGIYKGVDGLVLYSLAIPRSSALMSYDVMNYYEFFNVIEHSIFDQLGREPDDLIGHASNAESAHNVLYPCTPGNLRSFCGFFSLQFTHFGH